VMGITSSFGTLVIRVTRECVSSDRAKVLKIVTFFLKGDLFTSD